MSKFHCFLTANALAINRARQEHLASLGFPMTTGSVLEVGAGIGLHTAFWLDRGCSVTITEGRADNLEEIRRRWPGVPSQPLDLDLDQDITALGQFDMVYCYGLLYHLGDPEGALRRLASVCTGQLFLELICNRDIDESLQICRDPGANDQSLQGPACRPSRLWILNRLREHWGHGYISITQPDHDQFPIDWQVPSHGNTRAIFIASKTALDNDQLSTVPLQTQTTYKKGAQT